MNLGYNSLSNLSKIRKNVRRKRISSHDRTGANSDNVIVPPNEKHEICNISGAGNIRHVWMTLASADPFYLRKIILRMWWDNEEHPSVEVPIGDFFGVGHSKTVNYWSLPLSMGPEDGKGFNCWFPMPFSKNARIEVENQTELPHVNYFYIDYEEYDELDPSQGRFHACWNRQNPCDGNDYAKIRRRSKIERWNAKNLSHEGDYVILEAEGEGHYVGCHLDIHNLFETRVHNWPGEGDDYIEIDDRKIVLYGTGTEDYFCGAYCPTQYFSSPYFGIPLSGGKNWSGKISYYRYHVEDPIYFTKNIKVKIEHGHANQRSDDYSSTAYWYQIEPHKILKPLPTVELRIPRMKPEELPR